MSSPTQLLLCDCVTIVLVAIRVHLCDSRRFRIHKYSFVTGPSFYTNSGSTQFCDADSPSFYTNTVL